MRRANEIEDAETRSAATGEAWHEAAVAVGPGAAVAAGPGAAVAAKLGDIVWRDAPIPADWVVSGRPHARCVDLSRSADGLAVTAAWDCTAGAFTWHNFVDETVHILEGEVSVTAADGASRLLLPGDVVLFPAGTTFTWNIPCYVRKVAFMRHAAPPGLGGAVRLLGRLHGGLLRRLSRRLAKRAAA